MIALIAKTRCRDASRRFEKTSFASSASGDPGGQPHGPTTGCLRQTRRLKTTAGLASARCLNSPIRQPDALPLHDVRYRRTDEAAPRTPGKRKALNRARAFSGETLSLIGSSSRTLARAARPPSPFPKPGGARRDRTDDLMLAKHALSQLSYGPGYLGIKRSALRWWAWEDLNFRPHAYQARALTN